MPLVGSSSQVHNGFGGIHQRRYLNQSSKGRKLSYKQKYNAHIKELGMQSENKGIMWYQSIPAMYHHLCVSPHPPHLLCCFTRITEMLTTYSQ
jgi:hypothetical protein